MIVEEELCGCELVLIHLDDESFDISNGFGDFNEHSPFKEMQEYLKSKGHDMISFTNYINEKYKIQKEPPLWEYTAKEFYATTKSRNFYKTIIRTLKLELLCRN